ncbi:hypothetical protein A2160_01515 [Candidatus Beckwithbacteria bacterium RBG_13_42_9]|uniref:tRNA carboxymethyluridine synthase n=1 Tax=Candidatus Beckwithbacteria bacterium RBG_13_42_9 TaxID=1797457 RepID=A0A1F5E971_9BACT|nr:MAG: hypothetical protein A2160_01515 [Candidatus Beckwithbacteria bacterium RBG_13_42_9]
MGMYSLKSLLYQDLNLSKLDRLEKAKRRWAKVLGNVPKNSQILEAYKSLVKEKKATVNPALEKLLKIRKIRTLSGVAPLAIMMKPFACPGKCVYCPQESGMPKSYLSNEPAAARAKKLNFNPKKQLLARIKQLKAIGHQPEKLQIIVIGGTFSAYPDKYKKEFLKAIFDAANGKVAQNISQAQKWNEKAPHRIVGLSIETRPDWITDREIKLWREYGVTKVQLGVQALDDKILKLIDRGHNVKTVARASEKLRNCGFKICYHLMPNLPGSSPNKDIQIGQKLFNDSRFRPDTLKIYPCVVIPKTTLYEWWQNGQYQPYSDETLIDILVNIKRVVPSYCRIDRLIRDIPNNWIAAGSLKSNLRQMVKTTMASQGLICRCIRCREVKDQASLHGGVRLKILSYSAGLGKEVFLSFEDKNYLYALLRLRLPSQNQNQNQKPLFPVLKQAALIRELQVFGPQLPLSTPEVNYSSNLGKFYSQHQNLGKKLIKQAEVLAKKAGYQKIAVISGVGVRDYYRQLGYNLKNTYMVKKLC